MLQSHHLINN